MAFWGKLGGAAGGFFLGGPLGAVAGALAGHFLVDREIDPQQVAAEERDQKSLAFTIGVIALSAKMAKADGVVAPVEVEAFRKVFHIDDEDLEEVQGVFDRATYDVAGYESYARQLHDLFEGEPATLEDVLHGLAHIAAADGAMHEAEIGFLTKVAGVFALDKASLRRAFGRYVQLPDDDPYEVLGVDPEAPDSEVKRRHRELVAENHPDRATARGLPPEAIRIATSKLAVINAAWDAIRSERALA